MHFGGQKMGKLQRISPKCSPFPITSVSAERRFPRFPWLISTTEYTEPLLGVTEAATNFASRHHSRHWLAHNSPCAVLAPSDTGSYFPHHWLINPPKGGRRHGSALGKPQERSINLTSSQVETSLQVNTVLDFKSTRNFTPSQV